MKDVYFTDYFMWKSNCWLWTFSGPGNVIFVDGTSDTSQNPVVQFDATGNYMMYTLKITTASGSSY